MEPGPFDLLERYGVPGAGRLDAWSIQERYGLVFVAISTLLWVPVVQFALRGERDAGFWALTAFAAVTLLVGLAVARLRETLSVDGEAIRLSHRSLFEGRSWVGPRSAIRALRLTAEHESDDSGTRTIFPVALALELDGRAFEIRVFKPTDELRARRAAEEIAGALELPVIDAIGDEAIIHEPGESASRFARSDSQPTGPIPPNVTLSTNGHGLSIRGITRMQTVGRLRWAGLGFLLLATTVGAFASRAIEPAWFGWLIPFPFWGAGLYFLADAALGRSICERLWIEGGELVRERAWLALRFSRRRLAIAELEAVRVQSERGDEWGLAAVARNDRFIVGGALEADQLAWLENWLLSQLDSR